MTNQTTFFINGIPLSLHSSFINHCLTLRTLKQALQLGLKIDKIHRVLQFNQKPILKAYIDLNTKMRQEAKDDFHKSFFKLMSNSFYGKCVENVFNYRQIRIVKDLKTYQKLSKLPNFKHVEIISFFRNL